MRTNTDFHRIQARHRRRVQDSFGPAGARWRAFRFTRADLFLSLFQGLR